MSVHCGLQIAMFTNHWTGSFRVPAGCGHQGLPESPGHPTERRWAGEQDTSPLPGGTAVTCLFSASSVSLFNFTIHVTSRICKSESSQGLNKLWRTE